jgi:preprotein translocase subunit SecF
MVKLFPLRLIPDATKYDFMGIKRVNYFISLAMVVASFVLLFSKGLNFGIDFTGGVIIEAKLTERPDITSLRSTLEELRVGDITVQNFDVKNIMIRVGSKGLDAKTQSKNIELIKSTLSSKYGDTIEYRKIDFVGPQVGKELIESGFLAVVLSFLAIMVYVAFRFEWQYGVGIVIALMHDVIVTVGVLSYSQLEFDVYSIAAILTIIGYSVNDSVVIYDRIRENIRKFKKLSMGELINLSINETLSRTVLTVLTTLIAVAALIIYGGSSLYSFSVVVFFGIIIGTYSSVYVSAPILINLGINKYKRS